MALGETFDLARIYGAAAAIKEQKSRNELLDQRVRLQNVVQSTASAAVDPQTGEYSPALHARALSAAGYPQAGEEILGNWIGRLEKTNQYVEAMLPRLNAQTYPAIKRQLEKAGVVSPGYMPETFDQKWVDDQLIRMGRQLKESYGAFEELYRGPEGVVVGQRGERTGTFANIQKLTTPKGSNVSDKPVKIEDEDGTLRYVRASDAIGRKAPKPAGAQGKQFRFTASDTNAIYRQSAGLFGGLWDPVTNTVSGMDKETAARVQNIAAKASQIYREGAGDVDHATAVEQALQDQQQPGQSAGRQSANGMPPPGSIVRRKTDGAPFRVQPDGSLAPM
jgi:hypothetical protein